MRSSVTSSCGYRMRFLLQHSEETGSGQWGKVEVDDSGIGVRMLSVLQLISRFVANV